MPSLFAQSILRFSKRIPHFMRRPDFRTPPLFFVVLIVSVLATGIRQSRGFKSVGFRLRLYATYKKSTPCRSGLRIATPRTRLIAQPDLQELEFTTAYFLDTGILHVVLYIIKDNTGPLKTYKLYIYNGEARALYDG